MYSLYQSDRRKPPLELIGDLDALVFDVQRCRRPVLHVHHLTDGYAMEAAAEAAVPFYVLDRPNPINGVDVEGPVLDTELESFVGYHRIPVRHGMTVGELARMFNEERAIGADLTVVKMEGWRRGLWFDETGLPWVNPSPNIRNLDQATLYPGLAMLDGLEDYSVGEARTRRFNSLEPPDRRAPLAMPSARVHSGVRVYRESCAPRIRCFKEPIDSVQSRSQTGTHCSRPAWALRLPSRSSDSTVRK